MDASIQALVHLRMVAHMTPKSTTARKIVHGQQTLSHTIRGIQLSSVPRLLTMQSLHTSLLLNHPYRVELIDVKSELLLLDALISFSQITFTAEIQSQFCFQPITMLLSSSQTIHISSSGPASLYYTHQPDALSFPGTDLKESLDCGVTYVSFPTSS